MKKRIAVLLALMIGFTYCPSEAVVMATENEETSVEAGENEEKSLEQNEGKSSESEDKKGNDKEEGSFLNNLLNNFFGGKEEKEASDEGSKKTLKTANKKSADLESSGLKNLQIPQKLNVVIDPWEMDQREQVYSEQYVICNTGDTPGILTLSNLTCKPREKSGVIVRTDKEGLHDSGDKSIYMEMMFGNGERIIFSQESSQYQTELKPSEELSICFAGEVNENAFGKWENDDISISVVYSWETLDEMQDPAVEKNVQNDEEEIKEKTQLNESEEESENRTQDDGSLEEKSDLNIEEPIEKSEDQQTETDTDGLENEPSDDVNVDSSQETSADNVAEGIQEQETSKDDVIGLSEEYLETGTNESSISDNNSDATDKKKNEIKNIELQEPQKVDVVIDSWKVDEKGRIVSPQYQLQNTGETAGIWDLSELVCKPQEQSAVAIKKDKDGLHDSEEKAVYMELVIGNGDKIVLSLEKSQYKVELKPGEKLSVCFVGEMNGNLFETREQGDITVTAVCSWSPE